MSALHVLALLDAVHDAVLGALRDEGAVSVLLGGLLEQQDAVAADKELQEATLFVLEEVAVLVLELDHSLDLLVIVLLGVIAACSVNDNAAAVLDVLEGLEGLVQVAHQLRQLVGPGLADVALVNHQHDLHLLVDVEQTLHKERVRYLVLLALVVLEAGTVVEGHFLDDDLGGDGGLGVLFVADLYSRLFGGVESGLESVEAHDQLRATEEAHDGTLADARVADHDNGLHILPVDGDRLHAGVDELLQLLQVDGICLLVH